MHDPEPVGGCRDGKHGEKSLRESLKAVVVAVQEGRESQEGKKVHRHDREQDEQQKEE